MTEKEFNKRLKAILGGKSVEKFVSEKSKEFINSNCIDLDNENDYGIVKDFIIVALESFAFQYCSTCGCSNSVIAKSKKNIREIKKHIKL